MLHINPRIYIEAEESFIRQTTLDKILRPLVADILKNPRLKATREFYGSADDKRFALVNSTAFTWPADSQLDVADYQSAKAERKGKRLLGIRVDTYEGEGDKHTLTLTLLNAGGSDNGAVPGGGTVRYTARRVDEGWQVELRMEP